MKKRNVQPRDRRSYSPSTYAPRERAKRRRGGASAGVGGLQGAGVGAGRDTKTAPAQIRLPVPHLSFADGRATAPPPPRAVFFSGLNRHALRWSAGWVACLRDCEL